MTTVTDVRSQEETDLGQVLSALQEQAQTGTLKLVGDDERVKYVYFKQGTIELLKTNRSRTLLGKALLKRHKLSAEQLAAALERQRASSQNLRLGEILVGMGVVKESDVHQALAYQVAEEVFELFSWPRLRSEFFRGEPPLDIFESEDLQGRVSLSPMQLAREAHRRARELDEIRRVLASPHDVFAPTARAYRPENEQSPAIREVLQCLDGQRTLDELLEAVRAPDLVALRVLVKMVQDGDAVSLSAQELLGLGQALEERGEFARARRRYLRAEELGNPDFDLPRRIGQLAEALNDLPEACRRYFVYADRCDQAGYPDVAVQTLDRVLELDPDQHEARERYAELLVKRHRELAEAGDAGADAKAAEAAAQFERLLERIGEPEDQRRLLVNLIALCPEREDLHERMAELSLLVGDEAQAVLELQELAVNALEQQKLPRAVEILEKILAIDSGELMAVQSLASTYARLGRNEEAVAQYLRFATSLEESGLAAASAETLVDIYETIAELDPENTQARRYLARAYEGKEEAEKAVAHYGRMVESLRKGGDERELLDALARLSELRPTDISVALERAQLAKKLGTGDGAAVFRQVAEAAQREQDDATAMAAWRELLGERPGDLEGHLALARLEVHTKDHAAAARRCAAVTDLAIAAKSADLAYEAVKQALDVDPDNPSHRERLARVQVLRGRPEEAARTLVRAARRARDDEDLGVARAWARRALELDSGCDDARDLLENLRRGRSQDAASQPGRETVKATITGGSREASIEGQQTKTKRVGGIADRLRTMKLGPRVPASNEATEAVSRKASSAMNRLRALKGMGGAPSPAAAGSAAGSEGGGSEAASAADRVSPGPEGPGVATDAKVSKKASSAMDRLRALKGAGGAGEVGGGAPASEASGKTERVSAGPEGPGAAADAEVSKKASSAMDRLRALKGLGGGTPPGSQASGGDGGGQGGGDGGGQGGAGKASERVSPGPEGPGAAADAKVSKKASSAMDRLRALKGLGGATPPAAQPSGGEGGKASERVSPGPEGPGAAADEKASKKASSAMERLRALKGTGGAAAAPPPAAGGAEKASPGPEAPGEAAAEGVSKKASSAMERLRALKGAGSGDGGAPSPSPGPAAAAKISKGPEAPGEAADQQVSKKASSAMSRLRALKAGDGESS